MYAMVGYILCMKVFGIFFVSILPRPSPTMGDDLVEHESLQFIPKICRQHDALALPSSQGMQVKPNLYIYQQLLHLH